mmetsp:Transcript_6611/g.11805  ORF Transcript_6611/g.11805 Transcript_6611/m.11805 type:complete len:406 (-) Transcript_6611:92-1309(-)
MEELTVIWSGSELQLGSDLTSHLNFSVDSSLIDGIRIEIGCFSSSKERLYLERDRDRLWMEKFVSVDDSILNVKLNEVRNPVLFAIEIKCEDTAKHNFIKTLFVYAQSSRKNIIVSCKIQKLVLLCNFIEKINSNSKSIVIPLAQYVESVKTSTGIKRRGEFSVSKQNLMNKERKLREFLENHTLIKTVRTVNLRDQGKSLGNTANESIFSKEFQNDSKEVSLNENSVSDYKDAQLTNQKSQSLKNDIRLNEALKKRKTVSTTQNGSTATGSRLLLSQNNYLRHRISKETGQHSVNRSDIDLKSLTEYHLIKGKESDCLPLQKRLRVETSDDIDVKTWVLKQVTEMWRGTDSESVRNQKVLHKMTMLFIERVYSPQVNRFYIDDDLITGFLRMNGTFLTNGKTSR